MKKLLSILLVAVLLVGCSQKENETPDNEQTQSEVVTKVNEGDYDMLSPFVASSIRKQHADVYREVDVMEIGRRLIDKSKAHFSINTYKLSEGSVLDEERYLSLMQYKTEDNPNGLNTLYENGIEVDGSILKRPVFVRDLYEINFHKTNDASQIDGVSIAMVMDRVYTTDEQTGATVQLSDDTLFEIGRSIGLQLSAYMRTLENMNDIPIYIAIYVQESFSDKLPDNTLPGYYIGDALSTGSTTTFTRNHEQWMLLSSSSASELFPEITSQFSTLKTKVSTFMSEENVGVIGKVFVVDNQILSLDISVRTGAKTFTELYGVSQYLSQLIETFDGLKVPITVSVSVYQTTRVVISKQPNSKPTMTVLQ
ncbi:hypothetical protein AOC36_01125 [Erysipelothrix larvae]|uniref:CamS family sex pheromone protein n=1 Tax=Erysipelothrix larvae TaxID=1514105 RepID=A0A0X8GYA2_9FIRM|nr:CamS family sex pheromone protein [Erysipelothrix larvae]AMC92644.1 hypothetical protein AOC36_01125 [Erysipelothrix larvae]